MPGRGPNEFADGAVERTKQLTLTIVRVVVAATIGTIGLSFLEPRNDTRVTLTIHAIDLVVLGLARYAIHRDRPRVAAWMLSWMFWALVAISAWLFGGLHYELGAAYIVSVLIAGTTLGGREAMLFAGLSIAMSTLVLAAHLGAFLPEPITPPSVVNAWVSVTVSLLLGAYLLRVSIGSLEDAIRRGRASAQERDEAKERFLQAQKMEPVGRLAAGVAHDFNNLLSAISTISGVVRRRVGDDPKVSPLLDDLDGATERAAMMTRQLLAFSRARAPSFEVFELDAVLRRTIPVLSRLLGEDIRVELDLHAPGAALRADRSQLEQVLLNLTVNARDAMPNGGTLRISTRRRPEARMLRIEVRDEGVGIDAAALPHLFEPFFTTKSSGTGLGLATVRDIVDATGGSIEVQSEVSRGTTFVVEFPEHFGEVDLVSTTEAAYTEGMTTVMRILLVEDHELVRRSTRQALEDAGFDVTAVNDGAEALLLLEGGSTFDAVVSDLRMARLSGEGLALKLASTRRLVPFVFMSGHEDRLPDTLERLPISKRFLAKPVTADALVHAVFAVTKDHLRRSRATSRSATQ